MSSTEVYNGAVAAAHASGTEAIGQSTGAPAMLSRVSDTDVYSDAVAAAHPLIRFAGGPSPLLCVLGIPLTGRPPLPQI